MIKPEFTRFKADAKVGYRIPVFTELPLGEENVEAIVDKLDLLTGEFVLLESGQGSEEAARYSVIGWQPWQTFCSDRAKYPDFSYKELCQLMIENPGVKNEELPRFWGGALGFVSYDTGRQFEQLPDTTTNDLAIPDLYFALVEWSICLDHVAGKLYIIKSQLIEAGQDLQVVYDAAQAEIMQVKERLAASWQGLEVDLRSISLGVSADFEATPNMSKADFEAMVVKCKEYIKAGDIFQANLSIRLGKEIYTHPFNLYRIVRRLNPSPYMAYINFNDLQVVSSSPELLVRINDEGYAETRPIAGTRRRGTDRDEDLVLARELIENEKERAEHIMLVDLERNDLGRVCQYGTVEVNELMVIEEYSHVMHIVSNVRGRLHPGRDRFDLLKATFPGGTITGAPKIRSMEIIDELEPTRRGVYTGAIGYFGYGDEMEFNIVIRTLVIRDGKAYVQAGAGIVADSDPEREYFESLKKAEALLKTLELAEKIYGKGDMAHEPVGVCTR